MRFCQVDGTPLVDDAPPFDPYATIVSSPAIPAPVATPQESETIQPVAEHKAPEPESVASPIAEPEDVLDLPENDPLKTMYVSDAEMRDALGGKTAASEESVMELPPIEESADLDSAPVEKHAVPEPPSFDVPDVPSPSFGDMAPPPTPFSVPDGQPYESAPAPDEPVPAIFDEPATIMQSSFSTPYDPPPPAPVAEWAPPPAPDASWQNQEIGSNTPFQPPPAGVGSLNQTLPIISLILGIVSLCCYISPITGTAALITGFLGMKNVKNDPANYGGKGLAIAGMVTGGIMMLIGLGYYVVVILAYAGIIAGSILQGR